MDKEIISFKDFLSSVDSREQFESKNSMVGEDDEFEINEKRLNYLINDFGITEKEIKNLKFVEDESNDDFYILYRDVNENFSCDIFIEGANPEKTKARLIIESEDWNLIFNGKIENGKCVIPIKKLDILSENLSGKIKLEVIAEGNVFIPWENNFLLKTSKKISTLNEKLNSSIDVKVEKIK